VFDISAIQIAIVLVIALLVFGPKRLPDMARTLGKGIRDFRATMESTGREDDDEKPAEPVATSAADAPAAEDDLAGMIVPGGQRPSSDT
jgi:TatA/E family protein of Tat protein translocase